MNYLPCPMCHRDDTHSLVVSAPRRCPCGWWAAVVVRDGKFVVFSGRPGRKHDNLDNNKKRFRAAWAARR